MNRKKVMFYISSLEKGGAERVALMVAKYLTQQFEVVILTDVQGKDEYTLPEKVVRVVAENVTGNNRISRVKNRICALRKHIKNENPNVIIVFMEEAINRIVMAHFFMKYPIIGAIRSNPEIAFSSRGKRLVANFMYRHTQKLIFQTTQQRDFFGKGIIKKSKVIANPINSEFCRPIYEGKRSDKIVTAGRLVECKNHKLLIEAFKEVVEIYPHLTLLILGEGPLRRELTALVSRYSLNGNIILPGNVKDVASVIQDAKLFVMTSNYEGMPNALMEAMALGLPVISTDCPCGGAKFLINNEKNGLLVPMNDKERLVQAIKRIIENEGFAVTLGKNAREVQEDFAERKICEIWKECVEELC